MNEFEQTPIYDGVPVGCLWAVAIQLRIQLDVEELVRPHLDEPPDEITHARIQTDIADYMCRVRGREA